MIRVAYIVSLGALSLVGCHAEPVIAPSTQGTPPTITPGNGQTNQITLDGLSRVGSTLYVPSVQAETPSFLVVHPFVDGVPLREDYTAATYIPAGISEAVPLLLDDTPDIGSRMIIMLHKDANDDGLFQFGDGITVPDVPLIEGTTMIALPAETPEARAVTPDDIRNSYLSHAEKALTYLERANFRAKPIEARAKALVHRYMSEVERPDRSADQFEDILSETFMLNFSSGTIRDLRSFDAWLKGPASSVDASFHDIPAIGVFQLTDDLYQLQFEISWNGITPQMERLQARTSHIWSVRVNGSDMPLIERIDVEILVPFRQTEWE